MVSTTELFFVKTVLSGQSERREPEKNEKTHVNRLLLETTPPTTKANTSNFSVNLSGLTYYIGRLDYSS